MRDYVLAPYMGVGHPPGMKSKKYEFAVYLFISFTLIDNEHQQII